MPDDERQGDRTASRHVPDTGERGGLDLPHSGSISDYFQVDIQWFSLQVRHPWSGEELGLSKVVEPQWAETELVTPYDQQPRMRCKHTSPSKLLLVDQIRDNHGTRLQGVGARTLPSYKKMCNVCAWRVICLCGLQEERDRLKREVIQLQHECTTREKAQVSL